MACQDALQASFAIVVVPEAEAVHCTGADCVVKLSGLSLHAHVVQMRGDFSADALHEL